MIQAHIESGMHPKNDCLVQHVLVYIAHESRQTADRQLKAA